MKNLLILVWLNSGVAFYNTNPQNRYANNYSASTSSSNVTETFSRPKYAVCTVTDALQVVSSRSFTISQIFTDIYADALFEQEWARDLIKTGKCPKSVYKASDLHQSANGFADNNPNRLNELWFNNRTIVDVKHLYSKSPTGRNIDTDLYVYQCVNQIFKTIVDRRRIPSEQYVPFHTTSVLAADLPSILQTGASLILTICSSLF